MKKFGLLCLALVLALGAVGIAYAAWTDTIFISGTASTGEVCIEFTCPWSQTDPELSYLVTGYEPETPGMGQDWNATQEGPDFNVDVVHTTKNVGYTVIDCHEGATEPVKAADISLYNVYPCYFNHIGLGIRNCGTIPVKLDHVIFRDATGAEIGRLYDDGYLAFNLFANPNDQSHPNDFEIIWGDNFGDQLEPGGSWSIDFWMHVMQDEGIEFTQPQNATFTIEVVVVQWNEYPLQ
jgi:hypothetical protein